MGLGLTLVLACSEPAWAQTNAPAKKRVAPKAKTVERETVYVALPPKAAPKPEPGYASQEEPKAIPLREEPKKNRKSLVLPLERLGLTAHGGAVGFYHAEVLGANPFGQYYAEWFPLAAPIFFQFSAGIGTVQSSLSEEVLGSAAFDHSWMLAFEALGGYTIDLAGQAGSRVAGGLFPYAVAGITAISQGGVPNFGGVIGLGHRLPLPFMTRSDRTAMNIMIKEHIYSQKFRTEPSLTQNIVVTLGVQRYF